MNVAALAWAHQYKARPWHANDKRVLVDIASGIDHACRLRINQQKIADHLGLSLRTVIRSVHWLEHDGVLSVLREQFDPETHAQIANVFRVLTDWVRAMIAGETRAADVPAAASEAIPAPSPSRSFLELWKRRQE